MTSLLRTVVERPVLVTVVYLVVLLFGLLSYSRLSIDILPEVEPPVLTVVTPWPGAAAPDVERKLTEPLEASLGSLNGLDTMRSTSRDNASIVTLIFDMGADLAEATSDVRQKLEGLELVDGSEDPRILKFDAGATPAVVFAVTDRTGDVRLRRDLVEERLIEPIERIEGVGSVVLLNAPEAVVRVDVSRERLAAVGLTMTELAQILGAENVDVPAGAIDVGDLRFAVRMPGEATSLQELRQRVVQRSPLTGAVVRLQDVATVTEGLDDSEEMSLLDGQPSMTGLVIKLADANTVAVSTEVQELLATVALPEGMEAHVTVDPSNFIRAMVGNLQQTVAVGAVLVMVVVFAFLRRAGPSLVVATTIPTSMVTTFLVMDALGYTLNAVTLMAMALAIGMVVDNGIVVLENIARHADSGASPTDAAREGAIEVGGALLASTATTLVVFLPMSFASGIIGTMFGQLSHVMIATIASSLVVALTLTPMLAGRVVRGGEGDPDAPVWGIGPVYDRVLAGALRWPFATLGLAAVTVGVTLLLMGLVSTDFIPRMDQARANITLELPVGTSLDVTAEVSEKVADALREQPEVRLVTEYAGQPSGGSQQTGARGSHVAVVRAFLHPATSRDRSDVEVIRAGLRAAGPLPEVVNTSVVYGDDGGLGLSGKPVVVEILGSDIEELTAVARQVERGVRAIEGTVDVGTDIPETRPELRMALSREQAGRAGVRMGSAARELRAALTGVVATRYAAPEGSRDVVVRLASVDRDEPHELGQVPLRASDGRLMALGDLASPREGEAPIAIQRLDRARVITVSAGVEGRALGDVTNEVRALLHDLDAPDGVTMQIGGTSADQQETFRDLTLLALLGVVLVYLVMAAQFESWLDPFVILLSIPFAVTGAFLALLVTGTSLSMTSFLGLIILIGVVVNNAIVMLDYVKLLQRRGMERIEAVKLAGRRRLRPVLVTVLTTVGGMIPLALATGVGAELWTPMGRTALGGLVVSTVVTLVLVPVVYVLADRLRSAVLGRVA